MEIKQDGNKITLEIKPVSKLKKFFDIWSIGDVTGVYFIFDNYNNLLYIGKAQDIKTRLGVHKSKNTRGRYYEEEGDARCEPHCSVIPEGAFSYFKYLEAPKEDYSLLEKVYLRLYNPLFNGKFKDLEFKHRNYRIYLENKQIEN